MGVAKFFVWGSISRQLARFVSFTAHVARKLLRFTKKKKQLVGNWSFVSCGDKIIKLNARKAGFEPTRMILKTTVLPLNYIPLLTLNYRTLTALVIYSKILFSEKLVGFWFSLTATGPSSVDFKKKLVRCFASLKLLYFTFFPHNAVIRFIFD